MLQRGGCRAERFAATLAVDAPVREVRFTLLEHFASSLVLLVSIVVPVDTSGKACEWCVDGGRGGSLSGVR